MMAMDSEITEYCTLRSGLQNLYENFLRRKNELYGLLEKSTDLKKDVLLALAKSNGLTRHLTGRQRQIANLSYHHNEIKARLDRLNRFRPLAFQSLPGAETLPDMREDYKNRRELKEKRLVIIAMIDKVKKKLLQIELLELRCRELILAMYKALEAFRHEFRIIYRRLYPFGIFSLCRRWLRGLWGKDYFSFSDLDNISALGCITASVLKITDSAVL